MRLLITARFDGSDYCGFQSQINAKSIQDTIECAINMVTAEGNRVYAAGRTDEGVHAYALPMHFDTAREYPPERFRAAINNFLPDDIRIVSAERVDNGFHARYHALAKTYLYKLYLSREKDPLRSRFYGRAMPNLNKERMRRAASFLVGEHDFTSFMKKGSNPGTTVRNIYSITIDDCQDEMFIFVRGSGFLYNMVRIIVALLIRVGSGELQPEIVPHAILSRSREYTRAVAPSCGLHLLSVEYPPKNLILPDDIINTDDATAEINRLMDYQNRGHLEEPDNLHVLPFPADDE